MRSQHAFTFAALLAALYVASPASAHGPAETAQIGSTADGGGQLATFFHFDHREARLAYSTTLLTTSVYTGELPAFESLPADDAPEIYVLDPGTDVTVEVTDIQGSVKTVINSTTLDSVGDSVLLGTEPIAHTHPDWTLVLEAPAGEFGEGSISFKLTTTSLSYTDSEIYTIKLTNGPLPPPDFDTAAYDKANVDCRKATGKAAQKFLDKKLSMTRKCLDALQVLGAKEALTTPPADLADAEAAAEGVCVGETGTEAAKTLIGKIDAAKTKASESITSKCPMLSAEDISQNLGFVACRADQLLAATYPDGSVHMSEFTVQASQGGASLDTFFPCLHQILAE